MGAAHLCFIVYASLFPAHALDFSREPWDIVAGTGDFRWDGFDGVFHVVGEILPIALWTLVYALSLQISRGALMLPL